MEQSRIRASRRGFVAGYPVGMMKGRSFIKSATVFTLFFFVLGIHTMRDVIEFNGPPDSLALDRGTKDTNWSRTGFLSTGDFSARKLLNDDCSVDESDADCTEVHEKSGKEEQCRLVECAEDCGNEEGLLEYNRFVYCTTGGSLVPLAMVVLVLWWLFCFTGLAVCADDYFCPSLVVISKTLRLSPNVAGVTFLAFGNGAPDVFSALAALDSGGDPGLGLGGLLGAGMFVTTVVCGSIAIITPFKAVERPFLRDTIFYLVGIYWTFFVLWKGYMYIYEAIGFLVLWVIYVIVVVVSGSVFKRQRAAQQGIERKNIELIQTKALDAKLASMGTETEEESTATSCDDPMGMANPAFETESTNGSGKPRTLTRQTTLDEIIMEKGEGTEDLAAIREDDNEATAEPVQFTPDVNGVEKEKEEEDEEEEPLSAGHAFLAAINPINVEEWPEMRWYARIFEVFKCPLVFLMRITCPVVNYEEDNWAWNKHLFVWQMLVGPTVFVLFIQVGLLNIGGVFPVYGITLVFGAVLAVIVWFTSVPDQKPKYIEAFGWLGFLIALVWIYIIANEVVAILETFGLVIKISTGILGLTLLAWGNSIGDWIADTVMARQGFARMGFAACFGGPFFNLCLGFGIPMLASMARERVTTRVLVMNGVQLILTTFLMGSLMLSMVFLIVRKFVANRPYGIFLVVYYLIFLVIALLVETNVLMRDWVPS